ncbi:MAG: hypothetical protein IIZ68_01495 [Clostridia bacterium]|nr:hypothetical protein [Clostridia bacterium]
MGFAQSTGSSHVLMIVGIVYVSLILLTVAALLAVRKPKLSFEEWKAEYLRKQALEKAAAAQTNGTIHPDQTNLDSEALSTKPRQ